MRLKKTRSAPHVFCSIKAQSEDRIYTTPIDPIKENLKEHFLIVDANKNLLQGAEAMIYWASQQQLPIQKTIDVYIITKTKYLQFYHNNLIDGLSKFQSTKVIGQIGVDDLFYLDYYAIERFGKTKLGTLMHYAKQGQNKSLMKLIVAEIKNRIHYFIFQHKNDPVLFVPPTIKRNLQNNDLSEQKFRNKLT